MRPRICEVLKMADKSFYQELRDSLQEELDDGNKYAMLAKRAPTVQCRETLMQMAREEIMHRAHLEGMLLNYDG